MHVINNQPGSCLILSWDAVFLPYSLSISWICFTRLSVGPGLHQCITLRLSALRKPRRVASCLLPDGAALPVCADGGTRCDGPRIPPHGYLPHARGELQRRDATSTAARQRRLSASIKGSDRDTSVGQD
jgi:hypothetical protein